MVTLLAVTLIGFWSVTNAGPISFGNTSPLPPAGVWNGLQNPSPGVRLPEGHVMLVGCHPVLVLANCGANACVAHELGDKPFKTSQLLHADPHTMGNRGDT
jgi:hypothetical protein